jgi:SAM-dependent methyltransferase
MRLTETDIKRLSTFLTRVEEETYPEEPSPVHSQITRLMADELLEKYPLPANATILDIGCGQGPALELFTERGFAPQGITLNDEDVAVCRQKGFQVVKMDQSFLDFEDAAFDLVWCRHCIEHSVFPLFTLQGLCRVLRETGILYIEVPAPETAPHHEANPNHYSVLTKTAWSSLIQRSGMVVDEEKTIEFDTVSGPDAYWGFFIRKQPRP